MTTTQLNEADVLEFLNVDVNTSDSTHPNDPISNANIRVTLDQLRPYDGNPRQSRNPKFDSILTSIEARGLDHSPNISRRNPDDKHYMIIDGGNTRLEILNVLYKKYKDLAKAVKNNNDEERLFFTEKAQSFYVIDCTYKPWKSESSTLAGHMAENAERGDPLYIEKALAVQQFRRIYEEEDRARAQGQGETYKDKSITIRALAERITAQGWTVSHSHISRFEYAASYLLPVVPNALWAGAGEPLIKNIRRLEKAYSTFWSSTDSGQHNPKHLAKLFFETLPEFDDDTVDLDGFTRALDRALGDLLKLPAQTVCAEIGAGMAGITLTKENARLDSGEPEPPESSENTRGKDTKSPQKNESKTPSKTGVMRDNKTPSDIQEAIINVAAQLAARYELVVDRVDRSKKTKGCDWFIVHPLTTKTAPPDNLDDRAAVWWTLFRLSRTYRLVTNANNTFMETFQGYLSNEVSVTDVVLQLDESEYALPEVDREHLRTIEALIRQGSGLMNANTKD